MTEFRILVTGSRTWSDYGRIYRRLASLASADREGQKIVVIHGKARGADMLADQAAQELGYERRPYEPHWEFGAQAGNSRNSHMLSEERPHIVLAFWDGRSTGTDDMIQKSLDAGVYVEVHEQ